MRAGEGRGSPFARSNGHCGEDFGLSNSHRGNGAVNASADSEHRIQRIALLLTTNLLNRDMVGADHVAPALDLALEVLGNVVSMGNIANPGERLGPLKGPCR